MALQLFLWKFVMLAQAVTLKVTLLLVWDAPPSLLGTETVTEYGPAVVVLGIVNMTLMDVPVGSTFVPETATPIGLTLTVGLAPNPDPLIVTCETPATCPLFGAMLVIWGFTVTGAVVCQGTKLQLPSMSA
jgi:hypothetical protein